MQETSTAVEDKREKGSSVGDGMSKVIVHVPLKATHDVELEVPDGATLDEIRDKAIANIDWIAANEKVAMNLHHWNIASEDVEAV